MQSIIKGAPSFSYVEVTLAAGESVVAEAGAMASMDVGIESKAVLNGGLFSALFKSLLGGESFFVNVFTNASEQPKQLVLVQNTPGDVKQVPFDGKTVLCLQPGTYLASTPGVKMSVKWAGFRSWFAREGLFKLRLSGKGMLWFGAYGGILFKEINGQLLVDTSHLVAYEPQMKLKLQLAGGFFSSLFGGEGFVTRVEGRGKIAIQTRSIEGLTAWVNTKLI